MTPGTGCGVRAGPGWRLLGRGAVRGCTPGLGAPTGLQARGLSATPGETPGQTPGPTPVPAPRRPLHPRRAARQTACIHRHSPPIIRPVGARRVYPDAAVKRESGSPPVASLPCTSRASAGPRRPSCRPELPPQRSAVEVAHASCPPLQPGPSIHWTPRASGKDAQVVPPARIPADMGCAGVSLRTMPVPLRGRSWFDGSRFIMSHVRLACAAPQHINALSPAQPLVRLCLALVACDPCVAPRC